MTDKQPEALRLDDRLYLYSTGDEFQRDAEDAAAELRRLHELSEAVANLIKVKGRHNTEIAYQRLVAAYDKAQGDNND